MLVHRLFRSSGCQIGIADGERRLSSSPISSRIAAIRVKYRYSGLLTVGRFRLVNELCK